MLIISGYVLRFISFVTYTVHIVCTVHQTVVSIEHLPINSASFFVLLASFVL